MSAADEQDLCQQCGMCCDGTLFPRAKVRDGETDRVAGLFPLHSLGDQTYFALPCGYFRGNCTIYEQRPQVCANYACKALDAARNGALTWGEAAERVRQTRQFRDRLLAALAPNETLADLRSREPNLVADPAQAALLLQLGVLELLLDRHFRRDGKTVMGSTAEA